jgi:hypothetical protein
MSTNRQISQQPENWENRNGPDLIEVFPNKCWVESDFTVVTITACFNNNETN